MTLVYIVRGRHVDLNTNHKSSDYSAVKLNRRLREEVSRELITHHGITEYFRDCMDSERAFRMNLGNSEELARIAMDENVDEGKRFSVMREMSLLSRDQAIFERI